MHRAKKQLLAGSVIALVSAIAVTSVLQARSSSQAVQAPMFEVDPLWPKPLPEYWILGSVVGLAVDSRDHIYVVNLRGSFVARTEIGATANPPIGDCCRPAADVLEFDAAGTLMASWGGPAAGYHWPVTPSGIAVDPSGNVWIGSAGGTDTHILKFSREGRFLKQIGASDSAAAAAAAALAATAAAGARAAAPGGRAAGGAAGRAGAAADTQYMGVSGAGRAAAGGAGAGAGAAAGAAAGGGGRGAGGAGAGRAAGGGGGRGGGGGGAGLAPNSASTDRFGGPAKITFDPSANEAYVADGYRNRRVAVIDIETGAIKRSWGAYGRPAVDSAVPAYTPDAPAAQQFRTPVHCAEPTNDGMVYVCDRTSNRIQVFRKNGTFVREKIIKPATLGSGAFSGAVWDIAFSRDPQQRFMYVADGMNMRVHILERSTLEVLTSFGEGGRQPGAFLQPHSIVVDSRGNIYTGESSEGKRVQKFVFKGIGPVTSKDQGLLWPKR